MIRRPRVPRAALPGLAAAAGLLVALPGLFRTAAALPAAVPPGDVALVNQRPILMSDFVAQTEAQAGMPFDQAAPARRAEVLHAMIDEELAVQRGLALDLPQNDTDVRQALVGGVEAQVAAPVLAQRIPDDALRRFYAGHLPDFTSGGTMRVRNLVLRYGGFRYADQSQSQALQDATEAAYQLRAGAAIAAVADHVGLVDAAQSDPGDQFDFAAKRHLGDALFAIAATLNSGDVSDPVEQPDGVHLLVMLTRRPPRIAPFDQVRAAVYTAYRAAEQKRAQDANIALLRQHAQIILAPGAAAGFDH